MNQRFRIEVRGIVQGVGFRPYIYRLAHRCRLGGNILNSESGVIIEIEGFPSDVQAFLSALPVEAPSLARILEIDTFEVALKQEFEFVILESTRTRSVSTLISPDIATCDECVREMFDPQNRRYRYPFINCTNCGPRFTIVRSVPYDRKHTSMAAFTMCAQCKAEYDNPLDRRFHAQPNACWVCGPNVELVPASDKQDAVLEAIRLLNAGSIVAVKGLGGFHLAVDASNPSAVQELRRRKGRSDKPFAIMIANLEAARELAIVTNSDAQLLLSPQRPIVLLTKRSCQFDALAPDGNQLGLFLPYTPLHHLLVGDNGLAAVVMTSGNLSEEPIAFDNEEARAHLQGIADYFLIHNREILLRCDDSVLRNIDGQPQFARRSRGFTPSPIVLKETSPNILAVGGDLKNVICMSRGRYAFPAQHIGDIENLSAYEFFLGSIHHFEQILEVRPEVIAHDLHPGYLSTQWARSQAGIRLVGVQHHHAHIASCMAENQLSENVIGIALDGTGFGADSHTWGGEVLIADLMSFERAAHIAYTPMPGGEKCIHEPWRMAVANLWQTFDESWKYHAPPNLLLRVPSQDIRVIEQMLRTGTHSPLTSSCGRLFDAVSALVCGRMHVSYEAQAAIVLEACCDPRTDLGAYPLTVTEGACLQIDTRPLFAALTNDLRHHVEPATMSRRFHEGLMNAIFDVVHRVASNRKLDRVCLSGGSFQNAILAQGLKMRLESAGLRVFTQNLVPPGDGGLSLGQLVVAANQK